MDIPIASRICIETLKQKDCSQKEFCVDVTVRQVGLTC